MHCPASGLKSWAGLRNPLRSDRSHCPAESVRFLKICVSPITPCHECFRVPQTFGFPPFNTPDGPFRRGKASGPPPACRSLRCRIIAGGLFQDRDAHRANSARAETSRGEFRVAGGPVGRCCPRCRFATGRSCSRPNTGGSQGVGCFVPSRFARRRSGTGQTCRVARARNSGAGGGGPRPKECVECPRPIGENCKRFADGGACVPGQSPGSYSGSHVPFGDVR